MNIIEALNKTVSHLTRLTNKVVALVKTHSRLLARVIVLMLAGSIVAACQHNDAMHTTASNPAPKAKTYRQIVCKPWRPLSYNSLQDDPLTQNGVRVHNQTGYNLRCPGWKKP